MQVCSGRGNKNSLTDPFSKEVTVVFQYLVRCPHAFVCLKVVFFLRTSILQSQNSDCFTAAINVIEKSMMCLRAERNINGKCPFRGNSEYHCMVLLCMPEENLTLRILLK